MFRIEYKIVIDEPISFENLSVEDIQYNFLTGVVSLHSNDLVIEIDWDWIPLLDFAFSLQSILKSFQSRIIEKQIFEFTENDEVLMFSLKENGLNISASFSSIQLHTTLAEFEIGVREFHLRISDFVRSKVVGENIPDCLQKYLV